MPQQRGEFIGTGRLDTADEGALVECHGTALAF
jgi:hypothetical protein